MLLAQAHLEEDMQGTDWKFRDNSDAKQALIGASKFQSEVIDMCRQIQSDKIDEEKDLAGEISYKLGKYYEEREGGLNDAFACFNDATMRTNGGHKQAMIAIARIHQNQGQNDQCRQICLKILKMEPQNEEATYILANLMLMKDETEGAMQSYIQLLDKEPDNYNILANLIELLRKAGRINEAQKYIDKAEEKT